MSLPLEAGLRGLYALDREISAAITGQKGELAYRLFSPETMKIEEFRLRVLGTGELVDSLGKIHRGVLVEERTSSLPGIVTTEVYDQRARFLYSKTPVGLELEILRLEGDPRDASDTTSGAEVAAVFDVAALTVPVEGAAGLSLEDTGKVTVRFRGGGVAILQEAVRSVEQELNSPSGDTPLRIVALRKDERGGVIELVLELRNRSLVAGWADSIATDPVSRQEALPPEMERYLEGGFHLDLTNPRLEELLDRCRKAKTGSGESGGNGGGDIPIPCLERLVDRYIENKSLAFGFAGLEEILEKREGDCTEHALLLAAVLRKSGVPSRLAYGLILTEGGFIGHAWVEAYDAGRWQWLDPSFPGGRPYGLKIRLGSLDPAEPVWASLSLDLLQVVGTVEAEILEAEPR
jgi:hypothetical protein